MDTSQPVEQPTQPAQPQQAQKASRIVETVKALWVRLKRFIRECRRVVKVIQKPNKQEFVATSKVSALGLAVIGLIGFVLSMIQQVLL